MCSTVNFIGTDAFYLNGLHVLTVIEVPVHSLGAFVIIARTPKKMSNVKWTMLLLHFVGAFLDFYLSFIASPVLTLPMCAGYPLGVSLILGIPTSVQVYLGISFAGVITATVLAFFEDRYHHLLYGHISNGERDWKRRSWLIFHYCISMIFILPCYLSIPEQEYGREMTRELIPCLPSDIISRPGFFVLATNDLIPCLCISTVLLVYISQLLYFIIRIFRFLSVNVGTSQTTHRLQKQFFVALCLQVSVPLIVLIFPFLYIILSIWLGHYNQAYTNIAMSGITLHGVSSTITMLIVHNPYREATLKIINLTNRTAKEERGKWMKKSGGTLQ